MNLSNDTDATRKLAKEESGSYSKEDTAAATHNNLAIPMPILTKLMLAIYLLLQLVGLDRILIRGDFKLLR